MNDGGVQRLAHQPPVRSILIYSGWEPGSQPQGMDYIKISHQKLIIFHVMKEKILQNS